MVGRPAPKPILAIAAPRSPRTEARGRPPVAIDRVVERDGRLADLDLFDPRQHRFEDRGHFELGEMPTEAHVDAGAKTEVTPRIASDVEGVCPVECPLVAVRRRE